MSPCRHRQITLPRRKNSEPFQHWRFYAISSSRSAFLLLEIYGKELPLWINEVFEDGRERKCPGLISWQSLLSGLQFIFAN